VWSEEMRVFSSPGGAALSSSEINNPLWEEERNVNFSARPFLVLSLFGLCKPVQIMPVSLQIR